MPKIALTFDDGYMEHYQIAKALHRADLPATFYCITGLKEFEGKPLLVNDYEKLRSIKDMGHEIASHTHTHANLTYITRSKMLYEIVEPKRILERILKDDIEGIAYPYGAFNADVVNVVREHYSYARGTSICGADPWNLTVNNKYSIGALTPRHALKLLNNKELRRRVRFIVIYMHSINLFKLMLLVEYFRLLFSDPKFLTVKEIIKEL
jgi:peptidoglycan/xylan/chitin deacetylase (PgdA/CDA1 family)